jgi:hypothetical protein
MSNGNAEVVEVFTAFPLQGGLLPQLFGELIDDGVLIQSQGWERDSI